MPQAGSFELIVHLRLGIPDRREVQLVTWIIRYTNVRHAALKLWPWFQDSVGDWAIGHYQIT